jgi:uncharacterized alkaline shock family protein YloU
VNTFLQNLLRFWEHPLLLSAIVLLLLAIVVLLYRNGRRTRPIWISESSHGQISISAEAVRELARHTCDEVPTIRYRKSKLSYVNDSYRLEVHILVSSQIRLSDVSQYLQEQLTHGLRENLEFSELTSIDIVVDGFLAQPAPTKPSSQSLPTANPEENPSQPPNP